MTSKLSRTEIIEEVRIRRFSDRMKFFDALNTKTMTAHGTVPWPWALLIVSAEDWNDAFDQMLAASSDCGEPGRKIPEG
jgi:hypothetical protein